MSHSRRDFLVRTTCADARRGGVPGHRPPVRPREPARDARTPVTGNYRALVCVFLNGGSDSNNMIIPTDSTYYTPYAARAAGPRASRSGSVLAFDASPRVDARPDLRRSTRTCPSSSDLYNIEQARRRDQRRPARGAADAGRVHGATAKTKPYALFSHSDQVQAWQSGRSDIKISTGWGGRAADAVATATPPAAGSRRSPRSRAPRPSASA